MKVNSFWYEILSCVLIIFPFTAICQAGEDRIELRSSDNKVFVVFDSDRVYSVLSPDKTVEVRISAKDGLQYSVLMEGETVIAPSSLGILLSDDQKIGIDVSVYSKAPSQVNTTWQAVTGPRKLVANNYNKFVLEMKENGPDIPYGVEFRVYNEGAAFRYIFPKNISAGSLKVNEELTEFNFKENYTCWPLFLGSYTTMQEALYSESKLSDILPGSIIGLPLTVKLDSFGYCSIAEAALTDYAGAYITSSDTIELYSSPELIGGVSGVNISVDLPTGIGQIMLKADSLGSINHDHVDFAEAKLIRKDGTFVWLSDLSPKSARQDWGNLHFDESIDGNTITIGSQTYSKGLGSHANAVITFDVSPEFVRFESIAGIDTEVGNNGKAQIAVYANMASQKKYSLRTTLSRLQDQVEAVDIDAPCNSPWRVIMLGRTPVDLVNSDIIVNLNEPAKINDTSWIKPGVASWNWLTTAHDINMDILKEFIDLSAEMGWEYSLVDDGWYKNGNCTTAQDYLDIPELVDYAARKNVKLWLWVHWQSLNARMEQAMSLYEEWGIVGIKVDFMSRDDQWMVDWYHQVLETAASHRLMINFHGCYKPTGIRRTWPNLMTREAVYGLEQNFSSYDDPVHKTILPFTRMLAGPMDYTPGSFRNENKSTWRSTNPVSTLGTRCQELALCLVYDSPVVNMADSYNNYIGQEGAGFLKDLPSSWDETIALDGVIGQYYISARRKDNTWYLGGITSWDGRSMKMALDFLSPGKSYVITIYEDGPEAFADNARDVKVRQLTVDSETSLTLNLASGGGFVAVIRNSE